MSKKLWTKETVLVEYEVDEIGHKNNNVQDFIREQKIKSSIGCEFVRIKDGW